MQYSWYILVVTVTRWGESNWESCNWWHLLIHHILHCVHGFMPFSRICMQVRPPKQSNLLTASGKQYLEGHLALFQKTHTAHSSKTIVECWIVECWTLMQPKVCQPNGVLEAWDVTSILRLKSSRAFQLHLPGVCFCLLGRCCINCGTWLFV